MNSHKRSTYSLAFKVQAVEKYLADGSNLKATADELGVHPATMKHWVKKGVDVLRAQYTTPSSSMETEIKRLRKEVLHLKEENNILSKAAKIFAVQMN